MRNKRLFLIIGIAVPLIVVLVIGCFFIFGNNDKSSVGTDDLPIAGEPPVTSPESNDEVIVVKPFEGNSTLTDKRKQLLETAILDEIALYKKGSPLCDEYGSILTDEHGILIYVSNALVDYDGVETNLAVIINHFADKGYSDEAIRQLQRYYFNYARAFAKYHTENILDKLELCFPPNGTTPDELTEKAKDVFGQIREDGFPFVFEEPVPVKELPVPFCAVKAWGDTSLTVEREKLCIYDLISSENESEFNLEGWLHKIVNEMSDFGYGEKEIIVAQLLYAGSLVDTEYRHDLLDAMRQCMPLEAEPTIEEFKMHVQNRFDVNIEDNVALMDYLEGRTAYEKGVAA